MTWLVWRQHRAEGLIVLVVLVLTGVFLLITGLEMVGNHQYYGFLWNTPVLEALQLLLGALVGAPLLTREVEQRTHLLIWTQSITRLRWLMVTLALVLGAGLLASGVLLAVLTWWNSPLVQIFGSFGTRVYDTSGPVWMATTGLSLALGIFAGALTRRTAAAIFLMMVLFVAIRVPVEFLWRPNFEMPVTVTYALDQQNPPALSNQDWIVSQGFIDAQGNRSTDFRGSCTSGETATQCLQANDYRAQILSYQPEDRFWAFQWIETGIYVVFSVLALFATVWLVQRLN